VDECRGYRISFRCMAGAKSALIAFGGDSAIELASGVVLLWRLRSDASVHLERRLSKVSLCCSTIHAVWTAASRSGFDSISLGGVPTPAPNRCRE
jgi:hypothetical protein